MPSCGGPKECEKYLHSILVKPDEYAQRGQLCSGAPDFVEAGGAVLGIAAQVWNGAGRLLQRVLEVRQRVRRRVGGHDAGMGEEGVGRVLAEGPDGRGEEVDDVFMFLVGVIAFGVKGARAGGVLRD